MMNVLVGFAHVLGALIALKALSAAKRSIVEWETERNRLFGFKRIATDLSITVHEVNDLQHAEAVSKHTAERFSAKLFRNRISDLLYWLWQGWYWIGRFAIITVLVITIWFTAVEDPSYSVNAWWSVAIAIFFWVSGVTLAMLCKLITGRVPGQARAVRQALPHIFNEYR